MVGREYASRPGHTKDHHKNDKQLPPCMARNALELDFGSAAQLSKSPDSVWNCLWGNALKRSPEINRKSRVSYRDSIPKLEHLSFILKYEI